MMRAILPALLIAAFLLWLGLSTSSWWAIAGGMAALLTAAWWGTSPPDLSV